MCVIRTWQKIDTNEFNKGDKKNLNQVNVAFNVYRFQRFFLNSTQTTLHTLLRRNFNKKQRGKLSFVRTVLFDKWIYRFLNKTLGIRSNEPISVWNVHCSRMKNKNPFYTHSCAELFMVWKRTAWGWLDTNLLIFHYPLLL